MKFGDLYLDLRRPEYVPTVEIVISELVGQLINVGSECWVQPRESQGEQVPSHKSIGLVYESMDEASQKRIEVVQTRPLGESLTEWLREIEHCGFVLEDEREELPFGDALFDSLRGPKAKDAKRRIVLPMSPALAVLQDARGLSGRENPPNTATIVEQIYRLGAESTEGRSLAVEKLWSAMHQLLENDPLLRAINESILRGVLPPEISTSLSTVNQARFIQLSSRLERDLPNPLDFPTNPFRWFHVSWNRLTSPEWTSSMSSRRWLAWATSLIRTGVGFAYLWEARWYETLAREVIGLSDEPSRIPRDSRQLCADIVLSPTVHWLERTRGVSDKDISGKLKKLVYRGTGINRTLDAYFSALKKRDHTLLEVSFVEGLKILAGDKELVEDLRKVWDGTAPDKSKNSWEFVRYLLMSRSNDVDQSRSESAEQRDFYGLFRKSGSRYLFVDPSTEWVAVVASLARLSPTSNSTLAAVLDDLRRLGLQPSVDTLTEYLEVAGLARSAPDADIGIRVASAFGGAA